MDSMTAYAPPVSSPSTRIASRSPWHLGYRWRHFCPSIEWSGDEWYSMQQHRDGVLADACVYCSGVWVDAAQLSAEVLIGIQRFTRPEAVVNRGTSGSPSWLQDVTGRRQASLPADAASL
jgi:Zn-finger nucleic acid-binding protein